MKIDPKNLTLKDGTQIKLRAPRLSEAKELLDFLYNVSKETPFILAYPDDILKRTVKSELDWVRAMNENENAAVFVVEIDGKIVALSEVRRSGGFKSKHRGSIGISVREAYWNKGIGHILFENMIEFAKELGCTQMELGVDEKNARARHLYEAMGFGYDGKIPNAIFQGDGVYDDELLMSRKL